MKIYTTAVLSLLQLFPIVSKAYEASVTGNCDCGFNDPTYDSNWNEMWHINFNELGPILDGNNQQLYTHKDFFFSNYVIPAKFNDSYARVFRKENVFIRDESLNIGVTVENTTVLLGNNSDIQTNFSQPLRVEQQQKIRCGGIGTTRQDFLYGSFRSYMKTSSVNGTVAAMFLYHPDGEIDIELLSAVKPSQAYFAVHPGLVENNGKASALTHGNKEFDFDPTTDFHEYRFDWYPGLVIFFVDGKEKYRSKTNILSQPSRVMFNHWTDGNPKFSQGPAKEDAFFTVKNMTFFFNSSDSLVSSPKCISANRTCNIDKIVANLKNKSSTFDNYFTSEEPTHHINPYETTNAANASPIQLDLQSCLFTFIIFALTLFSL